jgi:hypothetical protein
MNQPTIPWQACTRCGVEYPRILSGLIIVWAGFTLGWAAMKLFFALRHHRPFPRGWR